jgi:peptide deformylase
MTQYVHLTTYPNPSLFEPSKQVVDFDDALRTKLDHMQKACTYFAGIGLAGVQIGYTEHIVFIDHDAIVNYETSRDSGTRSLLNKPLFMINPKIIERSEDFFESEEGCLSLPGIRAKVQRHKAVKVSYHDEFGEPQEIICDLPYLSACAQHEVDHINGITLLQHIKIQSRHTYTQKILDFLKKNKRPLYFDPNAEICGPDCGHEH